MATQVKRLDPHDGWTPETQEQVQPGDPWRDPAVTLPLNAMRCQVCGHRLDDMDGCDSCAADREAALIDGITEEGGDCG